MTGRVTGLAVMVEANDLRDLIERAITLSYVISADQDTLGRLEVAERRSSSDGMVKAEQARVAAEAGCGSSSASWSGSGRCASGRRSGWTAGGQAGRGGGRPAEPVGRAAAPDPPGGAGQAAAAPPVAAKRAGGRVGAVTCRHLGGRALDHHARVQRRPDRRRPDLDGLRARPAAARQPDPVPGPEYATTDCGRQCGRSGPMCATATARPPGPRRSGRPTAGTDPAAVRGRRSRAGGARPR